MDDRTRKALVRAEATLLRIPLFGLAVKGSSQLDGSSSRFHRRRGDQNLEAVIRTERDDKTPYPGPLSRARAYGCFEPGGRPGLSCGKSGELDLAGPL